MSSTSGKGKAENDDYPTPPWAIDRLLEVLDPRSLPPGPWLEPSAGEGRIIAAVHDVLRRSCWGMPLPQWKAVELNPAYREPLVGLVGEENVTIGDFLDLDPHHHGQIGLVVGNPPYSLADEFVQRALEISPIVLFHLRQGYPAPAKATAALRRGEFMRRCPPDVLVLPNRPAYRGGSKTDSAEATWMLFYRDEHYRQTIRLHRPSGRMLILDETPVEIRRAQRPTLAD